MPQLRAPKGGITIQGTFFPGGQFIPDEAFDAASDEQKAQIVAANQEQTTEEGFPPQEPQYTTQTFPETTTPTAPTTPTTTTITPQAQQKLQSVPVERRKPDEPIVLQEQLEEMIALGLQGYKAANGNVFDPIDPQREQDVIQRAIQLANTPVREYHRIRGRIYEQARSAQKTDEDITNYRAARLIDAYIGFRNRKLAHSSALHGTRAIPPKTLDTSMAVIGKTVGNLIERPQTVVNNVNKSPLKSAINTAIAKTIGGPTEIQNINSLTGKQKTKAYTSLAISESLGRLGRLALEAAISQGIPMLIRHIIWRRELKTAHGMLAQTPNANLNLQLASATPQTIASPFTTTKPSTSQNPNKPITYQQPKEPDPIAVIEEFLRTELEAIINQIGETNQAPLSEQDKQNAIQLTLTLIMPTILDEYQRRINTNTTSQTTPQPQPTNQPVTAQMPQQPVQYFQTTNTSLTPPSGPFSQFNPLCATHQPIERLAQSFWPQPNHAIPLWLVSLVQRSTRINLPTTWLDRLPINAEAQAIQKHLEQHYPDSVVIVRGPRHNHEIICGRHIITIAKQTKQPSIRTVILQGGGLIPMSKTSRNQTYSHNADQEGGIGHNQLLEMLSKSQNEQIDEELLPDGFVSV